LSKLESTKRTNAIFLLIVLVAGTFIAISPSFMTGVQAFQMENNYNNYESDYGMNSYDDKQSYGKDSNNYYKSKDSSSNVKCTNINTNVNGLEFDVFPSFLGGEVAAETTDTSSDASSFPGKGAYSGSEINDFRFICINNNNNNLVEGEEPQVPPTPPGPPEPTTTLTVKKQVFGCDNFPHSPIIMECEDL
jgi:hypothetical protein